MADRLEENSDGVVAGGAAFEMARMQLSEQFRAIEESDRKADRVLGIGVAVVGIYAVIVGLSLDRGNDRTAIVAVIAGIPLVLLFASAAVFFYRGYSISRWLMAPAGDELVQVAAVNDDARVRLWLAEQLVFYSADNEAKFVRKTRQFTWSLRLLLAEIAASSSESARFP